LDGDAWLLVADASPLAANPLEVVPTRFNAVAVAGMAWLIIGFIGAPRTFLYFAF